MKKREKKKTDTITASKEKMKQREIMTQREDKMKIYKKSGKEIKNKENKDNNSERGENEIERDYGTERR